MPYIEIKNKSNCSGCFACVQKCPRNCISMEYDCEGFLYPKVNTQKCINCGLCVNTCPIGNDNMVNNEFNPPIALGGWNNNTDIKLQSSSGGVFSVIAENVISNGGVVFGAAFDENIHLKHIMIDNIIDLDKLRRSKYVQSEIGCTYIEAKEELEKDRKVLFVGTPCQIAGLYAFLIKDYENLISIDLVCHGVPSPKIFKEYITGLEQKYNSEISNFNFRDKRVGWNSGISISAKFSNKKEYFMIGYKDNFINGFLKDLYLRPSCYDCRFSKFPRTADISLADFWQVSNYYPQLDDDKGTSLVLVNNEKGMDIIEECDHRMEMKHVNLELALKHNPCIASSVKSNPKREQFFRDYNKKGWRYVEKKYLGQKSLINKVLRLSIYYFKCLKIRIIKSK